MKRAYIIIILLIFSLLSGTSFAARDAYEYFQSGISFFDQKDFDQALAAFQKAVKEKPDFAEAYYNIGIIYDLQGKPSEAVKAYEKVIQIDPNVGNVLENLAQDCNRIGEIRKGMDYIKLAESMGKPVNKELYNHMWRQVKNGEKERPATGQVSSGSPSESKPWKHVSRDVELAIISLEKELEQEGWESGDLIDLGLRYRQKGEIDRAIETFTQSLSMNTNTSIILAELSLCYYFKGQNDLFVQNFEEAKESGYNPSQSLNDLYLQCKAQK